MKTNTANTFDADTGAVDDAPPLPPITRIQQPIGTIPSLINIPPQIAVTVFWMALGFGLCWWLTHGKSKSGG